MEAKCIVCGATFTKRFSQELLCSFVCADERQRDRQRDRQRVRAEDRASGPSLLPGPGRDG